MLLETRQQTWQVEELVRFLSFKIGSSQFCGLANCAQCLFKTRPYPKDNPTKERRGHICLPCNKKFLFRDVKHELIIKLEVRPSGEVNTDATEDDLDEEEL